MADEPDEQSEESREDPVDTIIFLTVLITGFLIIHFAIARLW
ncbi:MAG TPA: hypothetical protein VFF87_00270 [Hyphomicrobium sp.]|nr:hypothetical protein [Hyphomicrobium sp.]